VVPTLPTHTRGFSSPDATLVDFTGTAAVCARNAGLKQVCAEPPIYTIDNFLTDDECAKLIETAGPLLQRSKTHAAAGARTWELGRPLSAVIMLC
jgi:hypothetical protein